MFSLGTQKEGWKTKHLISRNTSDLKKQEKMGIFWSSWIKLLFIIVIYRHKFKAKFVFWWEHQQIRNCETSKNFIYLLKSTTSYF